MARLANLPPAAARRDRLPGLRQKMIDDLTAEIDRGDPILLHDFAGPISDRTRKRLAESPSIRSARRKLAALQSGEPVVVMRPSPREFPAVADIDWLDFTDPDCRPPRNVRVYEGDWIEPAWQDDERM